MPAATNSQEGKGTYYSQRLFSDSGAPCRGLMASPWLPGNQVREDKARRRLWSREGSRG